MYNNKLIKMYNFYNKNEPIFISIRANSFEEAKQILYDGEEE